MILPGIPGIELVAIRGMNRMAKHTGIPDEKPGDARIPATKAVINALEYSGDTSSEPSAEKALKHLFNYAGEEASAENVLISLH